MKQKRAAFAALSIVAAGAVLAAADALFHLRPIAAEMWWRAALASPLPALQQQATEALKKHATRDAALALVEFLNAKTRSGDLAAALRAAETLCTLSGRSFGASLQQCRAGRAWARIANEEWPEVLERINAWSAGALRPPR